jgi:hypothetical protein
MRMPPLTAFSSHKGTTPPLQACGDTHIKQSVPGRTLAGGGITRMLPLMAFVSHEVAAPPLKAGASLHLRELTQVALTSVDSLRYALAPQLSMRMLLHLSEPPEGSPPQAQALLCTHSVARYLGRSCAGFKSA